MRKYLLIMVALVFIAVAAIGVMPADKADVVQAVTGDGTEISITLRTWQPVGDVDTAFIVRFTYTGGHGSRGVLLVNVPRLETGATASQYRSAAFDAMVDVIIAREAEMTRLDESTALSKTLKGVRGSLILR